jgi:transposase
MYNVGLDVGDNCSSVEILDSCGKHVKHLDVKGRWPRMLERLEQEVPRPFAICFEASCGYGYLHDRLSSIAQRVTVAHPGQLRLIFRSKRKHNRIDAQKLAKLLYLDEVPRAHVPRADVRSWRATIEWRQSLLRKLVAAKNQIRSLLKSQGVQLPAEIRSLWTKKGLSWLGRLDLAEAEALRRDMLIGELDHLWQQIDGVEKYLKKVADKHPGVALLMTIPGVGIRTAEAFCAYVDDIDRFARIKQVGAYFGLVPCQDASGNFNRLGHITKEGPPTVRKLLIEAVWQGIRHSPTIRAFFERVKHDDPERKKIALVATGHHLLRVMAAMLRSGECWRHEKKKLSAKRTSPLVPLRKTPDA